MVKTVILVLRLTAAEVDMEVTEAMVADVVDMVVEVVVEAGEEAEEEEDMVVLRKVEVIK
jgi:hypothetical protein